MESYRDLHVWQKAMDLVVAAYSVVQALPACELYALGGQLRRSAVSVPANIAEGYGRRRTGDYIHHLNIAYGSLMELETHLLIASRLGYANDACVTTAMDLCGDVGRMLNALLASIDRTRTASAPDA